MPCLHEHSFISLTGQRMKLIIVVSLSFILIQSTTRSQFYIDPIDVRTGDVCSIVSGEKLKFDTVFTAEFLKAVSPIQLVMGVGQITKETGKCVDVTITKRIGKTAAQGEIKSEKGFLIPFDLTIEAEKPYLVAGLLLRPPVRIGGTISTAIEDLKKLDGVTSACVIDLTKKQVVASHDTTRAMPTGSTFKLYVLGELLRGVQEGKRRWDDVIELDSMRRSFPSGVTQDWPHGAPVTLHTLATQMISISDNTATDHLLLFLGRENIERQQSVMGHSNPTLNAPFLTTFNMFIMKHIDGGDLARAFLRMDEGDQRKLVNSIDTWTNFDGNSTAELGPRPKTERDVAFTAKPVLIDSVEWFATTPDLCRAMDWYRLQSRTAVGKRALDILAVNPGLDIDADIFPYIGYKGGSEAGVLNMTYLLRRRDNTWFAISVSWMNSAEDLDLTKFSGIVSEIIAALK